MTPGDESKHTIEQVCPPVEPESAAEVTGATPTDPIAAAPPEPPAPPIAEGVSGTQSDGRDAAGSTPPPAPEEVRGYEVLAELGRGGMGVVYKARHIKLDRLVALKLLGHWRRGSRRFLDRFLVEAEAVAELQHPNIVSIYDYGEISGRPYMSLEFCHGGSLAGLLTRNRSIVRSAEVVRDVVALVGQVARGVAVAHDFGIVHRDLKPANILLQIDAHRRTVGFADDIATFHLSAFTPKVSDFGLAKRVASDLTDTQSVMGTPAYMSPEQARGESKFVGPPADVWALGVILYECLTGERPFRGDNAYQVLARVQDDNPRPLRELVPAIPAELVLICGRCLEKNPANRYSTARELADDLMWFLRGEPISARPVEIEDVASRVAPMVVPLPLPQPPVRRKRRGVRRLWADVTNGTPDPRHERTEGRGDRPAAAALPARNGGRAMVVVLVMVFVTFLGVVLMAWHPNRWSLKSLRPGVDRLGIVEIQVRERQFLPPPARSATESPAERSLSEKRRRLAAEQVEVATAAFKLRAAPGKALDLAEAHLNSIRVIDPTTPDLALRVGQHLDAVLRTYDELRTRTGKALSPAEQRLTGAVREATQELKNK